VATLLCFHQTRRRHSRGQSLVEFALVIPIFLLMLFGLVDMGLYVYMNSTLSQATREAARVASVEAAWVGSTEVKCGADGGPVCPANLAELRADVLAAANRMMVPFASISSADLHLSCDPAGSPPSGAWTSPPKTCADNAPRNLASVRIELEYHPITPVIGQIFSSIPSNASTTMVIN
jgi:hypothetical protein